MLILITGGLTKSAGTLFSRCRCKILKQALYYFARLLAIFALKREDLGHSLRKILKQALYFSLVFTIFEINLEDNSALA